MKKRILHQDNYREFKRKGALWQILFKKSN